MELRISIALVGVPGRAEAVTAEFATTVLTRRVRTDDELRMQLEDILSGQAHPLVAVLMDEYAAPQKPDDAKQQGTPQPAAPQSHPDGVAQPAEPDATTELGYGGS